VFPFSPTVATYVPDLGSMTPRLRSALLATSKTPCEALLAGEAAEEGNKAAQAKIIGKIVKYEHRIEAP
jgi:hypothetical protein